MNSLPNPHFIPVKTTLPLCPLNDPRSRVAIFTARLLLRPILLSDLAAPHALRSQPEVMANNPQGRPDRDIDETRSRFAAFLPPQNEMTYNVAVCLRDAPGSEMIGVGGCYRINSGVYGWPVIGYMFRREMWGQGIATEFLEAWLAMWRELPRVEREVLAHPASVVIDETGRAQEVVTAFVVDENAASRRVLEKCGFEKFHTKREADLRDPNKEVELIGFRYVVGDGGIEL